MKEQFVIKQHYIPQCLLRNFANSKDQVFEVLIRTGKLYSTNFKNSMAERHTYEHPKLERNKVERYFQKIENYIGPAVERIIHLIEQCECDKRDLSEVKTEIFKYMREFIIFYYRSGALLLEFQFERKFKADRVFLMLNNVVNSYYIRELSKTIKTYYNFAIIKSDNSEFLLCDQYVSTIALSIKNRFFNLSNRHMGLKDVMVLIPLSAKYYVIFYDGPILSYIIQNKIHALSQSQVDEINGVIINNSYIKCIGYNREALERAFSKFEYQSPSATYSGGNGVHIGATLKKELFLYEKDKKTWNIYKEFNWTRFRGLGRNDLCCCGSGKKYKKCCFEYIKTCERMYSDIEKRRENNYKVHEDAIGEKGIAEFYGKSEEP